MNEKDFLKKLSEKLKGISEEDEQDILNEYEQHFTIGLDKGRTEEELTDSLGNPIEIAKLYKANLLVKKAEETKTPANIFRAVFATISVGFFNLIFIMGPFIGILALMFGLFAAAIAITASGITGFFAIIFEFLFYHQYIYIGINPFARIFIRIGITAFGLLFLIGVIYLTKFLYTLFIRYIKFNLKVINGRR